jgi:nucleotide-binding universal stress UspA family protein
MRAFDLSPYEINVRNIFRNASPAKLYEEAIRHVPLRAEASSDRSLSIGKVLVAVNLSDRSEATTIYAAEMAKIFDASLTVGYVYQPVPLCEYASETTFTVLEEQRRDLQRMLKVLTQKAQKSGVICESFFLVGEPAEQISILAREMGADLLITASHHPAFLGRIFNLDKAPPVKHWAPRPVLIYHEKTSVGVSIHRSFGILKGAKKAEMV